MRARGCPYPALASASLKFLTRVSTAEPPVSKRRRIPGTRGVPASLDGPDDAEAIVVACPPHPRMGGSRTDARLRAVGDALAERDVACCRIDYGPWDEGRAEQTDVQNALTWAHDEYDRVGLFGYSFGAGVALLAAAGADADEVPATVSVLAPPASIVEDGDGVAAVGPIDDRGVPGQVCYGERDDTVDWKPVVERARDCGWPVEGVPAGHFFTGERGAVASHAAEFLVESIAATG